MRFCYIALTVFLFLSSILAESHGLNSHIQRAFPNMNPDDVPHFSNLLLEQLDLVKKNDSVQFRLQNRPTRVPFTCTPHGPSEEVPNSVHKLRPADIKVVAALGDSLTAGFGAKAKTILNVFTEYRGISWSIGGDENVNSVVTMANILKQYNPNLIGFSQGVGSEYTTNSAYNRAITGSTGDELVAQAKDLRDRMKQDVRINMKEDWKVITILIGHNDLCNYCSDKDEYGPDRFSHYVKHALRVIRDGIPRSFVNLVLTIDVTKLYRVSGGLCSVLHHYECPCGTSSNANTRKTVSQVASLYNKRLKELVLESEFNRDENFTAVIQPFFEETEVPTDKDGEPDLAYFSPDCFHFSHLSHEAAGVALWNNMIEDIGKKLKKWTIGEPIECPGPDDLLKTYKN